MNEEQLEDLSKSLSSRAKRARRSAWFSSMLIVTTVFSIITFFYGSGLSNRYELLNIQYELAKQREILAEEVRRTATAQSGGGEKVNTELEAKKLDLELKKAELELKRTELEQASDESLRTTTAITESVTKVGAVLISLYLVQILLGLMRYHFKLADHIETMSEAVKLAKDDVEKLEKISNVIGVSHIDFGKAPQSPIDKLAELVKDLGNQVASIKNAPNK